MDERWRALLRRSRSDPGDQRLIAQAMAACSRAGVPIPSDLFDRQRRAPRTFRCEHGLEAVAERLDGQWVEVGRTPAPSTLSIPECRTWWVRPHPIVALTAGLAAALAEERVPGLSLQRGREHLDASLPHLGALLGLSHLSLQSCKLTDEQLAAVPALPHLSTLNLAGAKLSGAGLLPLRAFPNLVRLVLDSGKRIKNLQVLAELPRLQRLGLNSASISDRELRVLRELPALTHLDLEYMNVGDRGLAVVGELSGLQQLIVGGTRRATSAGVLALGGLQGLRMLMLRRAHGLPGFESAVGQLRDLRWLVVDGWGFDLEPLLALPGLRRLELRSIPGAELARIAASRPELEHLSVRVADGGAHGHLEDLRALDPLSDLQQLRRLELGLELFERPNAVARVVEVARTLPRLKHLRLSGSRSMKTVGSSSVMSLDWLRADPGLVALAESGVEVVVEDDELDRRKPTTTSRRTWSRWSEG